MIRTSCFKRLFLFFISQGYFVTMTYCNLSVRFHFDQDQVYFRLEVLSPFVIISIVEFFYFGIETKFLKVVNRFFVQVFIFKMQLLNFMHVLY